MRVKRMTKEQRTIQIYFRCTIAALMCLIALFTGLFICLVSLSNNSAKAAEYPRKKYYTSYEVKSGDTLWSIGSKFRSEEWDSIADYVREVEYINNINPDRITAGNNIILPYYSYSVDGEPLTQFIH